MFCKQCGSQLAPGIKFCTTCGLAVVLDAPHATQPMEPMEPSSEPFAPTYDFNAFESNEPTGPKKPMVKWIAVGAGALVAVLIAVISIAAANDAKYLKPGDSPALADSLSSIKVDAAAQGTCSALSATIPSDADTQALVSRSLLMNKYVTGVARRASTFLNATSWINETEIPDISAAMDSALAGGLDEVIAKTETIRESDRSAFAELWSDDFKTLAIAKCGLQDALQVALSAQSDFSSAKDNLISLAASVPWYPDGYTEWASDSNVAWKWVNGISCNLGDWCWHVKVITASGCPDGLYAELNELDSGGNVIDYSNDTLPSLGAGATAVLEFSTYNSRADTGQMTTISCHAY